MGRTQATVINVVDPDVIVPGGGLSNLDRLYRAPPEKLPASDRLETAVLPPRHGASGGAREAAWLWRPGEAELAGYGTGP